MRVITVLLSAVLLVSNTGCMRGPRPQDASLQSVREQIPAESQLSIEVPRKSYETSLQKQELVDRIRLVEILRNVGQDSKQRPEYRLFNIDPKSPYHLLGLRNADVLVAANDFPVNEPSKFRQYAKLLVKEKGGSLIILRENELVAIKFSFVD